MNLTNVGNQSFSINYYENDSTTLFLQIGVDYIKHNAINKLFMNKMYNERIVKKDIFYFIQKNILIRLI